jgi:L-ascorbate metabolism protein UlaG (beta-lactamase superfamily)
MDISYLGHSAFKLRGKDASVVTDPFDKKMVGFAMPQVSADVVTVSHNHPDHNAVSQVSGTARRKEPYVITAPGEYEASGIGVFGWGSVHDASGGSERGKNTIYSIIVDGVRTVHLGDLGEVVSDAQIDGLGAVDVLLLPVGGVFTIDSKQAMSVIEKLAPSIVIPMHYKTDEHGPEFSAMSGVEEFLQAMGISELEPQDKFKVTADSLPEQTTVVLMKRS